MKKTHVTIVLMFMLLATACASRNSAGSESALSLSQTGVENSRNPEELPNPDVTQSTKNSHGNSDETQTPAAFPDNYYALVESYIGNADFGLIEEARLKPLSDLFKGHYEIMGRTAGDGLEYYLAVRRKDAPVYDDVSSLNVGYLEEQFYIGYYDRESEPVVLYELDGYDLLDMPLGNDNLDCFCLGIYGASDNKEYPEFHYAFSKEGRAILDFMKGRPELSFYREGQPFVKFYYQNEDTIKFYSGPYPCYVALTEEEQEEIRGQIAASKPVEGIQTSQEAKEYLLKNGQICSTGASLSIDGRIYRSFGNHDFPGYMTVVSEDGYEFRSLIYNEDVYGFIMDKVKHAIGMDYGNFDSKWFQTSLKSATIAFPEYIGTGDGNSNFELRTQTIENRDKLDALSKLMDQAIRKGECGFSACPYVATIDFVREDGETLRIFGATDSCDSMSYEGRICFEYGSQAALAAIFDEAMKNRLTE